LNFTKLVWSEDSRNENSERSFCPYLCNESVRILAERISSGYSLEAISFRKPLLKLKAFVSVVSFKHFSISDLEVFVSKFSATYSEAKNRSCSTGSLKVISRKRAFTLVHSCCCVLLSPYA